MMRVLDIIPGTSVDGPGLRTSIYFSGCNHHCKGCHNPQSWDLKVGREMSADEIIEIVEYNGFDVTFSGGDPLFQAKEITPLAKKLHELGYNIWCYTGFLFDNICTDDEIMLLLDYCDVLVDGPFVEDKRDVGLIFRGSSNQRLINLKKSSQRHVELWKPDIDIF